MSSASASLSCQHDPAAITICEFQRQVAAAFRACSLKRDSASTRVALQYLQLFFSLSARDAPTLAELSRAHDGARRRKADVAAASSFPVVALSDEEFAKPLKFSPRRVAKVLARDDAFLSAFPLPRVTVKGIDAPHAPSTFTHTLLQSQNPLAGEVSRELFALLHQRCKKVEPCA